MRLDYRIAQSPYRLHHAYGAVWYFLGYAHLPTRKIGPWMMQQLFWVKEGIHVAHIRVKHTPAIPAG